MPNTSPDLATLIGALGREHIKDISLSWVIDQPDSPEQFQRALRSALSRLLPPDFSEVRQCAEDRDFHPHLLRALQADTLARHIAEHLGVDSDEVSVQHSALYLYQLCWVVLDYCAPARLDRLLNPTQRAGPGYSTFSLASDLWAEGLSEDRVTANWMAVSLLSTRLLLGISLAAPLPLAAQGLPLPREDLAPVLRRCLQLDAASRLIGPLRQRLQSDFMHHATRYVRRLTAQEIDAGELPAGHSPDDSVMREETLLDRPAAQALQAMLYSRCGQALGQAVLDDLEWYADPEQPAFLRDLRAAITRQAIADGLFAQADRRPGYIGDFNLFAEDAAYHNGHDLPIDLANHLRQRFGGAPADAQWLAALTLGLQAPELLLRDIPADFSHEQSFRLVNLRHGLALNERPAHQLSFAEAEATPVLKASLATTADAKAQFAALRTPAILAWAEHHGVVPHQAHYSQERIEALTLQYDALCATATLADVPARAHDAAQRLLDVGIDAYAPAGPAHEPERPGQQAKRQATQVELYLDNGCGYRHARLNGKALADPTAAFETLFDVYAHSARELYQQLVTVYLEHLRAPHALQLRTAQLTFFAVHWHEYIGKANAVPSRHASDDSEWRQRPSTGGLIVLAEAPGESYLYQLFPKQLTFQATRLNAEQHDALADPNLAPEAIKQLLALKHTDFHLGDPQPYNYSSLPSVVAVNAGAGDNLQRCVHALLEHALLARLEELRSVCRGQTPLERSRAAWAARSDGEYAWKLIKNTIPFVGCADVNAAGDLISCLLDVVPDVGTRLGGLSRLFASAHRLSRASRLPLGQAAMTLASKKIAGWLAARGSSVRLQLRIIGQHAPHADFIQHQSYSRLREDLEWPPTLGPGQRLAMVDDLDQVLVRNVGTAQQPQYRLQHATTQALYGPPLLDIGSNAAPYLLSSRQRLGNGHYPNLLELELDADQLPRLPLERYAQVRIVERELGRFDVLVEGRHYQVDTLESPQYLRKLEHTELSERAQALEYRWVTCKRRKRRGLDLKLNLACVDHASLRTPTPPLSPDPTLPGAAGIVMSEAYFARRYALQRKSIAAQSADASAAELDLMVHEGKFVKWAPTPPTPTSPKRPQAQALPAFTLQPLSQSELNALGLPAAPQYRQHLRARFSAEPDLGLPANVPAEAIGNIDYFMPKLVFIGISEQLDDVRTLRGIRTRGSDDVEVIYAEVDDLRIFTAEAPPPNVDDPALNFRPATTDEIDQYLEASYSYYMVRHKMVSHRDRENIARLIYDVGHLRREGSPPLPDGEVRLTYDQYVDSPLVLKNGNPLLAQAERVLTSHARQGEYAKIMKDAVPNFFQFSRFPLPRQQAITERLNALLPVQGKAFPDWLPLSVESLMEEATAFTIFKQVGSTNLSFAEVTLEGGQQLIYYALSGKRAARKVRLKLDVPEQPRTGTAPQYIDTRRLMQDVEPDPSFSTLPVVPDAATPKVQPFPREQDSERFIATILRQDLLGEAAAGRVVTEIHVFTLFDTCRSCGAVVLPRLRADFPEARFSVSYLLQYDMDAKRRLSSSPGGSPATSP
jgi:hypothetical protein